MHSCSGEAARAAPAPPAIRAAAPIAAIVPFTRLVIVAPSGWLACAVHGRREPSLGSRDKATTTPPRRRVQRRGNRDRGTVPRTRRSDERGSEASARRHRFVTSWATSAAARARAFL